MSSLAFELGWTGLGLGGLGNKVLGPGLDNNTEPELSFLLTKNFSFKIISESRRVSVDDALSIPQQEMTVASLFNTKQKNGKQKYQFLKMK